MTTSHSKKPAIRSAQKTAASVKALAKSGATEGKKQVSALARRASAGAIRVVKARPVETALLSIGAGFLAGFLVRSVTKTR